MGNGASVKAEKAPEVVKTKRSVPEARASIPPDYAGPTLLSADVGGTGARLHLFLPPDLKKSGQELLVSSERMIFEKQYKNAHFESFVDILRTFLKEAGLNRPPMLACLAVAGVVVDNTCRFVNLGWVIDGQSIEKELGIQRVELINDFVAQGYGILTLNRSEDCEVLQDAPVKEGAPIAVIGAGTGLGEAFLTVGAEGDYEVWPSEGGHAEYAPRQEGSNQLEFELLAYLQIKYSAKARVSVERVAAGRGIANIYEFLAWKYPEKVNKAVHRNFVGPVEGPRTFDPAAITKAASQGICELSRHTVDLWAGAYGAEAGVVALTYMPFGGLYLTGGVTSKMKEWLSGRQTGSSQFMEAFLDKGRVTPMLMRVPVFIVMGEDLGERGAMLKATRLYLEQNRMRKMSIASKSKGAPEFIKHTGSVKTIIEKLEESESPEHA
eukprot:TRINITY_DN86_c0_g1_i1.p1 TRINITY_DN86_c0_g1~~TRINITY_DN86_c0_g1_i1.p1  ORF type:complete len:438 (-),score=87.02 TRINITY_DN86_c0_g1_i1:129-1442(-)